MRTDFIVLNDTIFMIFELHSKAKHKYMRILSLWSRFGFWHLGQQLNDFLFLIVALPQFVDVDDGSGNFLNLIHVDTQLGEPRLHVLLKDNAGNLQATDGDL